MLRTTKWKLEKAKVKVVFRLQFHATNIPQSGWEKLYISFIPTESGKITAKTSKANVRNGTCKWADPIYETTRLLVDSRNKRYDDNLYRLVVGMGTSRSSILGEAIINLADYADASDPFVAALPLHGSDSGTILHVTVQLLTAKTGFREFEQQFDKGLQNSSNLHREVEPNIATPSSSELQISDDHGYKVNSKTHFGSESKELISPVEDTTVHEELSDSPVRPDDSSNASETYYAHNIDSSSIHEPNSDKVTEIRDSNGPPDAEIPTTEIAETSDHRGWNSDYSTNNDLAIAREENHRLRGILEMAESSIFELKSELNALHSYTNEMGTETQKIAHHLLAEISSGRKLERDITVLRSECSKFHDELQRLKEIKSRAEFTGIDQTDHRQLERANGILLVEDRIRDIQRKIRIGFPPDLSLVNSDLEAVLGIVQDLETETVEFRSYRGFDLLDGKTSMLLTQLDESKAERENLVRKMNEMECYYEGLVQELEENQKQILGEFQSLRYEHSTCAYAISTCKSETESLRHEMHDQAVRFTKERHALGFVNEEIERRVLTAESLVQELQENQERILSEFRSLKNEHSTCAETESAMNDRISGFTKERDDFCRVNEELEKRVLTAESLVQELRENNERVLWEFRSLKNEHSTCAETISTCKSETESVRRDMNDRVSEFEKERCDLGGVNEELEKRVSTAESALKRARLNYSIAVTQLQKDLDTLSGQVSSMFETNQNLIKDTFPESSNPFSQSHPNSVENVQKSDDSLVLYRANLYLDVYTVTLEETLFEYAQKLELSNQSSDVLFGKLNDVQGQNGKLEASLESVTRENFLLTEKITEREALLTDYGVYKGKYEAVSAEKLELEKLLEVQRLDSGNLRKELSVAKEELETLKAQFFDLENSNESMQKVLDFLHEKFGNLLASCEKQFGERFPFNLSLFHNTGFRDITHLITKLEDLHNHTNEKIEDLTKERDVLRSEIDDMRSKFTLDMRNTAAKLELSNTVVEKLQSQLESIANKFKNSSELTESYIRQTDGILTHLSSLELELQKLCFKDGNTVLEISGSDSTTNETETGKSTAFESGQENRDFKSETAICDELETENIRVVLKATLNEHYDEYITLENKCNELTNKLKECEKREPEGASESLRIAFMKERCEITVQELKHELSVSKRHGEEVLLKLQDVLDETESRKKSEASYVKKIEEFSFKIAGLEAELESVQAERDCALLNLEFCKEEREKIVASMNGNASTTRIVELEGTKTKNSILSMTTSGSSFQDLQIKLSQLHKANEELGGMYPNFKDFAGDGEALERVLALEIELAEALMANKNSGIQLQSCFLKQHGDEEEIFKSFRDINEVIKDTLEIKSKYANLDTELKEMHERYSQLSLQFAEVEGERQKLMMTIKSSRSPKNLVRSSSETLNDSHL